MLVNQFMTANVVTIDAEKNILEAREYMRCKGLRRIPVVDDIGRVRGIITNSDINRSCPSEATTLSRYEASYLLSKLRVQDVMSKNVITVKDNAGVEDAAYLLYQYKINALPVLNEEGKLCGIITDSDIFRAFVEVMGLARNSTRITIDVTDKIGVVAEVGGMFRDHGINIISIVSMPGIGDEDNPKSELTIRADLTNHGLDIIQMLRDAGYEVTDISTVNSRE